MTPDLAHAAACFQRPPVTRFAPSPTGYLHLGHVVNAIYVWGIAGALGGRVLLRIEDHDRTRCRSDYERAIVEDLTWLGFVAPMDGGSMEISRQSERGERYAAALAHLRGASHVFACDCSRSRIAGERYDGYCRDRQVADARGAGLRVQLGSGCEQFDDLLLGRIEQSPDDQCGDLLLRDRNGHWTYQFAVTVDDLAQEVTLIVRGRDLVESTGRQLRLGRMLMASGAFPSRPSPIYLHHPLVLGSDGTKLSKSIGSAGVRGMRQKGMSPSEVIGRAARAAGLTRDDGPVEAGEVAALFRPR